MASRQGELGIDEVNVLVPDRDDTTAAARVSKEAIDGRGDAQSICLVGFFMTNARRLGKCLIDGSAHGFGECSWES